MKLSCIRGSRIVGVALLAGLWALACSSDEGDSAATTGGAASVGGAAATGGKTGVTGGKTGTSTTSTAKTGGAAATGGTAATGGASSGTAPKTGGAPGTGGTLAVGTTGVGGANVGGVTSVGGANVGGATAMGGTTAAGGSTSDGGPAADAGVACDGCLTLYVPYPATEGLLPTGVKNTATDFVHDFGSGTPEDLSTEVVTARVYVDTFSTTGGLRLYAINDNATYTSLYSTWSDLATLNGGWHEITLDLASTAAAGDAGAGFDKGKVRWLGLNISSGEGWGTTVTSGGSLLDEVTVYVDSIKFSDHSRADFVFDANALEGFAINKYSTPPAVVGSTLNGVPLAN